MRPITKLLYLFCIAFSLSVMAGFTAMAEYVEPMLIAEPIIFEPIEPTFEPYNPGFVVDPGDIYIPFEEDPYIDDPSVAVPLDFEILEDARVLLKWERYDGPDFLYYKILASTVTGDLSYPRDGYLDFYEDQNNLKFVDQYPPYGVNFYRMCVITITDLRGCSNPIEVFVEPYGTEPSPPFDPPVEDPVFEEPVVEPTREIIREYYYFGDKPVDERPELDERPVLDNKKAQLQNEKTTLLKRLGEALADNLGVVLAVFGVIIAVSGFTFASRRKQKSISKYMNKIDDTYSEYKMKAKRCEAELYRLRDIIDDELKTGKIEEGAYQLLLGRIENYMIDIQKQIVNEKFGGLPATLKDQMFQMMEDGEITEGELETMQKLIKRSELSATEQDSLLDTIKDFKRQDEMMKKKK